MPTSSFSTSNVKDTIVEAAFEGIGQVSTDHEKTFEIRQQKAPALRLAPETGVGNLPTWNGAADLSTDDPAAMDAQTLAYLIKAVQVRITRFDIEDNPGIESRIFKKVGFASASTAAAMMGAVKATAFSVASVHGGKTFFATDHERAGGTRSNRLNAALDRTAYNTARQMLREWVNYQNQKYNLTAGGFILEVPPALEETARQIVQSEFSNGSFGANTARADQTEVIVNEYLTDANDWILHVKAHPAFILWIRSPFEIIPDRGEKDLRQLYNCVMALAVSTQPTPDGAIGASVT